MSTSATKWAHYAYETTKGVFFFDYKGDFVYTAEELEENAPVTNDGHDKENPYAVNSDNRICAYDVLQRVADSTDTLCMIIYIALFFYSISTVTMVLITLGREPVPFVMFLVFACVWTYIIFIFRGNAFVMFLWMKRSKDAYEKISSLEIDIELCTQKTDALFTQAYNEFRMNAKYHVIYKMCVFLQAVSCIYLLGICGALFSVMIGGGFWKATSVGCSTLMLIPGWFAATLMPFVQVMSRYGKSIRPGTHA